MIGFIQDFIVALVQIIICLIKVVLICLKKIFLHFVPIAKKSLEGEVVLVTGAGSGIGKLMAEKLASREKCTVVLWDINYESVQKVSKEINARGGKSYAYKCDLSDRHDVYKVAEQTMKDIGSHITILINNAGICIGKKFLDTPDELAIKTMEVNCFAHYWTWKAFLPKMIENKHGHIVSIASNAGRAGTKGLADYCASKFAAVGFDESMRYEMRDQHPYVKTTCVCPFFIDTGMFTGVKSMWPRLLPILQPDYVAEKTINAIKTEQRNLILPRFTYLVPIIKSLPTEAGEIISDLFGISLAMNDFVQTRTIDGKKN